MAAVSYQRRPVLTDGRYVLKYRDSTGQLRSQVLEDTVVKGVSDVAVEASVPSGEDVSDQIEALKVAGYETEDAFASGTLHVYYNGLNISNAVSEDSNTTFSLSEDYAEDMVASGPGVRGDSLWITYSKA